MGFAVRLAKLEEKHTIESLIQPYLDELSQFPDEEPDYKDENGIYQYPYLEHYWRENERFPYLLYADEEVAGFALVRLDGDHWEMAEFYVLPELRRRGVATQCVIEIFERHPGEWKIMYDRRNQAAGTLWRKLAESCSRGDILDGEEDAYHDYLRFLV